MRAAKTLTRLGDVQADLEAHFVGLYTKGQAPQLLFLLTFIDARGSLFWFYAIYLFIRLFF